MCDQAYARRISLDQFREALKTFNLRLTKQQIKRLEYVLNEDMDGSITYVEYQQALEAYNLCGEKHFVGNGPGGRGYVKFETLVMDRFVKLMKSKNISATELFNSCDEDGSGSLSLDELKRKV